MELSTTYALINYFIREKYYGSALAKIVEFLHQEPNCEANSQLILLKSYCFSKLGKTFDAIRMLKRMDTKNTELQLAVLCALRIAYTSESTIDRESLKDVESSIQKLLSESTEMGFYMASMLLIFEENFEKARFFTMRIANLSPTDTNYMVLRGWLETLSNRDLKAAAESFERAISIDNSPDAFLGKAKIFEKRRNAAEMRNTLNSMISAHPSLLAAYIELVKTAAMLRNWEEIMELLQKIALVQSDCIPAQLYELIHAIIVEGDPVTIENLLSELSESVNTVEPTNAFVYSRISTILISLMIDSPVLIDYAKRFLERASLPNILSGELLLKRARLALAEKDTRKALQIATKAAEIDSGPLPFFYLIQSNIELGNLSEAKSQFDFLKATHKSIESFSRFLYLRALIARAESNYGDSFLDGIRQCVDLHLSKVQNLSFGLEYIEQIDVTFLTELAAEILQVVLLSGLSAKNNSLLKEAERVLVFLFENFPGLWKPCYLLTKVKYWNKDFATAEGLLRQCIEKDHNKAEAYLLLAQTYLQKQNFEEASKVLDMGLSFNFKVREHSVYYLTKAKLEKSAKRVEMSVDLLQSALEMPGFKDRRGTTFEEFEIAESDRIAVYLELIDSLRLLNRIDEADSCMNEAIKLYSGMTELQEQLVLMNSDLQLRRGNVDGALSALQGIRPDQPNYQTARIKMAQIYLEEKHDKHKFAICYREILERDPSPRAHELLGDAYMSIQEPTNAIEAYETAMRRSPKDHLLAEKIANAYVKCHLYNKAITFYEAAMKSGRQNILRIRFAKQLFQMGNFDKCKKILREVLESEEEPKDVSVMRDHVEYWTLLSKLHLEENNWTEAVSDLGRARQLQIKIVGKVGGGDVDGTNVGARNTFMSQGGGGAMMMRGGGAIITGGQQNAAVDEEKKLASGICSQLAEMYSNRRDFNKAIEYYKEAISLNEKDVKSMLASAVIFMNMGKVQLCNQQCQAILVIDPNNTDASLLMADLMYQQSEGEEAIKHFAQILDRNPNHYHALARYIELVWRRGNMELIEKALKNAVENNPRASIDAGYNYCKGLAEWYTGEPNDALQAFNRARRDLEWGERALYNMIEICLNPDNEIIGSGGSVDIENDASEKDFGIKTADRFFKELRLKPGMDQKYKIVDNFISLASSNKANVQTALNNFLEMCRPDGAADGENRLNVGAILGSARAHIILKQTQKAKTQLKQVIGYSWNLEEADYLQQCLLLLADLYINQGKNDQATSLLRTVLQHNASCSKAYEYMGFLCERDQKNADAACNYEVAWKLCKNRNPAIGYKLAYNYFKCRRLFECIEVCHIVLKKYPTYPKIKKELLDKARANIRT